MAWERLTGDDVRDGLGDADDAGNGDLLVDDGHDGDDGEDGDRGVDDNEGDDSSGELRRGDGGVGVGGKPGPIRNRTNPMWGYPLQLAKAGAVSARVTRLWSLEAATARWQILSSLLYNAADDVNSSLKYEQISTNVARFKHQMPWPLGVVDDQYSLGPDPTGKEDWKKCLNLDVFHAECEVIGHRANQDCILQDAGNVEPCDVLVGSQVCERAGLPADGQVGWGAGGLPGSAATNPSSAVIVVVSFAGAIKYITKDTVVDILEMIVVVVVVVDVVVVIVNVLVVVVITVTSVDVIVAVVVVAIIIDVEFSMTFDFVRETKGGTTTHPYTPEEEAKAAAILKERREKKEAKKKALLEQRAAKLKKIEEEMAREKERLKKEEEGKLKEVEEEEEEVEEEPLERGRRGNRGESSETKEDLMEKKISEWVAGLTLGEDEEALMYVPRDEQEAAVREWEAESDPLKRQVLEDEKRMEWKFRLTRERKRRMEAATEAAVELEEIRKQRDQMAVQVDLLGKVEILAKNVERLVKVQEEQLLFGRGQDIAVHSIRSGLRDFAPELAMQVGLHVTARLEGTKRYCVGAIEGAKLTAPKEEEARPRREPVKVKFPDSYSGKKEENFDNWEANVKTYVHLQKVSPDEQILIVIHALKEEVASFARSLVRAANCSDDVVAYPAFTPLTDFLKLLCARFADVSRSIRASDRLQTIHSRQWRSAKALKGVMDELVATPDHGVTETQLVNLFYQAMPESLRGNFFEKSQQPTMTYDALSREVVAFEAKSASVSTFWHKDLDKGKRWKGRTISGQVKTKDSLILTLDEGSVDEIPYDQIEWGLEGDDSSSSQGRTYAAVAAGRRPQGGGRGQGQGGRASGNRSQGDQGVGGRGGNRQAGGRGQGPPQNRSGNRSPYRRSGWHPGLPQGRPWEDQGLDQRLWQHRVNQGQCIYCSDHGHIIKYCPKYREAHWAAQEAKEDSLPFDIVLGMDWGEAARVTLHLREHECRLPSPSGGVKTARLFHVSGVDNSLTHCCLSAPAFARLVKKEQLEEQVFVAYVRPVTEPKEKKPIDPAIAKLLEEFTDLAKPPTGVVPRPIQHRIEIEPGSRTPKGAVYRMSPRELEELRKQLDELLEKGWIRPSSSPFGTPVLFVPKKEGELRMCIDYKGLNAITVKNAEPLPRIDDLLDRVQGCRYFTKIDLKSGYHQIEVHPDDQYKTAFRTRYGHYEFIVMPFGLTNALATFQRCINDLFRPWLDRFVVVYLDDILVFSKTPQEHQGHLRQVLEKLREANFKINAKKCEWVKTQVLYLGHVLDGDGIKPEDSKIAAIRDWPTPRTLTELQSFLGLANYYRKFVRSFFTIAAPLRRLLRKETIWKWDKDCTSAMKKLKQALIEYPVLKVADPSLPFVVTMDAKQYGIGAVLQQDDGNGYRPVEFMSARMPSEKVATSTYERELYALRSRLSGFQCDVVL
ncbi:hypothetical protein CBR_g8377 [Chara braunii]|uniref:Reverse transcriptase domain-containing protein n=1 Tax=Chara braunii TaxID=69332 RepID=A0A388KM59_CHABU|nr:hypothetical protein CBR_g8377 [Chara braunii]|eukprot:GBG71078.1 hypothetical protein CBR_g8377 [Chara braunii]